MKRGRTRVPDNVDDYPKTKRCTKCSRRRPIALFGKTRTGRYFYFNSSCNPCRGPYNREYTKKNRLYHNAYKLQRRTVEPWDVLRSAWRAANKRHADGVQFTFEELKRIYIRQNGLCALSGIKMTWANGTKRPLPTSISIDRVNAKKGYTKRNIRLVCYAINSFRQSMTDKELLQMAKAIVKIIGKRCK